MPTLSATSTALFTSLGLTASSIYNTFISMIGTAVDFGMWSIQVALAPLLIIGFLYFMWRMIRRFMGFGR